MSSPNDPDRTTWLSHRWLKLRWIFNLARGLEADARPFDLPKDFAAVFRDLKAAIDRQDIDSSPGSGRLANQGTKTSAVDLGKFLSSQKPAEGVPEVWSALTDLQHEWAQVQGIPLVQDDFDAPAAKMNEVRSGFPGRPNNSKELVETEFKRRAKRDECKDTLTVEVDALIDWLIEEYPTAPRPTPKTVKNNLRRQYRTLVREKA